MSADHRKPVLAFVVLALVAAGVVGVQRADAQGGRLLAGVVGSSVHVEGTLPASVDLAEAPGRARVAALGPVFTSLADAVDVATAAGARQAGPGVADRAVARPQPVTLVELATRAGSQPVGVRGVSHRPFPGRGSVKSAGAAAATPVSRAAGRASRQDRGSARAKGRPAVRPMGRPGGPADGRAVHGRR